MNKIQEINERAEAIYLSITGSTRDALLSHIRMSSIVNLTLGIAAIIFLLITISVARKLSTKNDWDWSGDAGPVLTVMMCSLFLITGLVNLINTDTWNGLNDPGSVLFTDIKQSLILQERAEVNSVPL